MRTALCGLCVCAVSACSPAERDPDVGERGATLEMDDEVVDLFVVLEGPSAVAAVGSAASSGSPDAVRRTQKHLADLALVRDAVRPHLVGLGATIVVELSRLANAFHVRAPRGVIPKLEALPHVISVEPVPLFRRSLHSSLPVVGAPLAWASATPVHGDGIKLGIMDTGIDYLHADFAAPGDPDAFADDDPTIIEPGTFPTSRVAGGYDFAGNDYNPSDGEPNPVPDDDPIDCDGHGTHVAGIAAGGGVLLDGQPYTGPYDMSFDIAQFRVAPGVAPRADLYAIKVFGCDGSTRLVAAGLEWAVDPNGDGDLSDRLDVVNASLGSPYGIPNTLNGTVIESFHLAGGLFVAASGNEGGTFFVTGAPGNFPQSLSVAATVDNTFISLHVDEPVGIAGDYAAVEASFTASLGLSGPVSGELVLAVPALACEPLENAAAVAGNIVLIDRGDCFFQDKLDNARDAGAAGAIVVNNTFDNPFSMGGSPDGGDVDIPGVMMRLVDGDLLKQALAGGVSVTLSNEPFVGEGSELIAGFSSRGPSSFDGRLKPEMSAPGTAIDSADVGTGFEATSKQGTSMATPFVAGAAALVRQVRPTMTPSEVKAVLINAATPIADRNGNPYPVSMQGSGRLDVLRSIEQFVTASVQDADGTVAITFDPLVSATDASSERTLHLHNHGDVAVSYAVTASQVLQLHGVAVSVAPSEVTVAPGSTEEIVVTLDLDPLALADPERDAVTPATQTSLPRHFLDEADGHVVLTDLNQGAQSMVVPFYGIVRAASAQSATPAQGCMLDTEEVVAITLVGDSAHPDPLVSVFELGALDPVAATIQPKEYDVVAFGVATDAAVTPRFDEVSVHFAVAVHSDWTTPAKGSQSVVGIAIDVDRDGSLDYSLRLEPLNPEEPFYDVLATSVYDLKNGGRVGSQRYINMRPANEADTNPFFNSVVVLTAFAHDIGLSDANTQFDYAAFSEGPIGLVQITESATFDLHAPRVDAARSAPEPGLPVYRQNDAIVAHLGARDDGGLLPPLLILHHNAAPGARFETVDPSAYTLESFAFKHSFSPTMLPGARPAGKVEITNTSEVVAHDISVIGSVIGGSPALLAPSHGSCRDTPSVHCELGSIPPGATRSITIQLAPNEAATSVGLDLRVRSAAGCELPLEATIEVDDATKKPPSGEAGGGCNCSVPNSRHDRSWLLALAGLAPVLRRRQAAGASSSRPRCSPRR